MTHARTTIRDAIVAQLISASITGVGSSVFSTRFKPIQKSDLPIITVYTLTEEVVDNGKAERFDRELTVNVEAYVEEDASENVDLKLDNLAEEIEDALNDFKANCRDMDLVRTDINVENKGDLTNGVIRLSYLVKYSKH